MNVIIPYLAEMKRNKIPYSSQSDGCSLLLVFLNEFHLGLWEVVSSILPLLPDTGYLHLNIINVCCSNAI